MPFSGKVKILKEVFYSLNPAFFKRKRRFAVGRVKEGVSGQKKGLQIKNFAQEEELSRFHSSNSVRNALERVSSRFK